MLASKGMSSLFATMHEGKSSSFATCREAQRLLVATAYTVPSEGYNKTTNSQVLRNGYATTCMIVLGPSVLDKSDKNREQENGRERNARGV